MTLPSTGPWEVREVDSATPALAIFNQGAAKSSGRIATVTLRDGFAEQGKANARLIAAAPEMLFLLELCMAEDQTESGISIELIRECRALIDGVKG